MFKSIVYTTPGQSDAVVFLNNDFPTESERDVGEREIWTWQRSVEDLTKVVIKNGRGKALPVAGKIFIGFWYSHPESEGWSFLIFE